MKILYLIKENSVETETGEAVLAESGGLEAESRALGWCRSRSTSDSRAPPVTNDGRAIQQALPIRVWRDFKPYRSWKKKKKGQYLSSITPSVLSRSDRNSRTPPFFSPSSTSKQQDKVQWRCCSRIQQRFQHIVTEGEIKKIVMGLDKNTKTPCGFCFIMYYSREDTEDSVKYISGTILDDRPIRVDFDWGFQDGRQWGRGRSGGQVVDYGVGSLGSFQPPPMAANYGRHGGGGHGYGGGGHRHGRGDYQRKRYRDDDRDRRGPDVAKRNSENETRRNSDFDSKQEKNPRFREHGDSDEEEDDRKRQK
ncbi:unnamed protein product [Lactuca virosa]|uniref:RRM domain-containing protein n=1 Tax=Lactuca virosa TaxID=75947 RepID=A0AAU9LSS6_9ASTR|nr:unnamed protein product [Lactuca virosa]